jgi:hypothetical protein
MTDFNENSVTNATQNTDPNAGYNAAQTNAAYNAAQNTADPNAGYAAPPVPVKIMSEKGYIVVPKTSYASEIIQVLISVFLIIGGLSKVLVLRFTQSSDALVVVGFLFLAWDIYSIIRKSKQLEEYRGRVAQMSRTENAVVSNSPQMAMSLNVRIAYDKSMALLNFGPRLNGNVMKRDAKAYEYSLGSGIVRNILNFDGLDISVVFDIKIATEIDIRIIKEGNTFGVIMPSTVQVITPIVGQ